MSVLGTLFQYEIRMVLRDTRTILISVVAPFVLFPLFIVITNWVESREEQALEEATYSYAVMGDRASWALSMVDAAIAADQADPDTTRRPVNFELATPQDPLKALEEGDIQLVVRGLTAAQFDSVQRAQQTENNFNEGEGGGTDEAETELQPPAQAIQLLFRAESDFSRNAESRMDERLREVRRAKRDSAYAAAGFPISLEAVAPVTAESVASAAKEAGVFLGIALTPFLIFLMLGGGSIVAADAISGEKERGTLETLLTTAASRTEIVRAKLLAIMAVGLVVGLVNVINLALYLGLGLLELPASLQLELGAVQILLFLVLFVPLAVLVASALLLLSGVSKSYKEFQTYSFPLLIAFFVPSMAAVLPGVDLASVIAFIPVAGVAVANKEILVGELNWPFIAIAFASTGGFAAWLTARAQATLSNERLISSSDLEEADLVGGAALWPRHALRWFGVMWVLFLVASLWLEGDLGIRGQLVVNLVIIMFGGSLLAARVYKLDLRETFSLKMPRPQAFLGAVIGAPSALVLGVALGELVNTFVFPVPERMIESFSRGITGPDLPLWQIVLFLSVFPGFFEEFAFRGALQGGLRKSMRNPWIRTAVVGAVFGLFHVSLFRIIPTGFLGFIFAWSVILSGSIYPAMLWHALNNAIAIVPDQQGWIPEDLEPSSWWILPAALGLWLAFVLLRSGRVREGAAGDGE